MGITTPLMEAIRAQLPENIKILLEAGADPNGIPIEAMSRYAAFFLRLDHQFQGLWMMGEM